MSRRTRSGLVALVALAALAAGAGAEIVRAPPKAPDPERRYLIYLHGAIVEGGDPRPVHPRWGVYDYPAVLEALDASGAVVVAEQRSETVPAEYAERVVAQVRALLAAGVPAGRIGVVGFSKGGAIAIRAAHRLADPGVRFVLLGACAGWIDGAPELRLHGRVLSIREKSDPIGSTCRPLAERAGGSGSFDEQVVSIGGEHGAFYRPAPEWVRPALAHLAAP
jgi:acetyl esterase/lipase